MNIPTLRQTYNRRKAWGLLASIDLSGCDHELIQSPPAIKAFVSQMISAIKMKTYGPMHLERFAEGHLEGYSVMQFIETSSLTIHFDHMIGDRAFIDIFSCKFFDPMKAEKFAKKYFKAKKARTKILLRY
jgi:S-adenosylmethionine decarboxylase